MNAANTPRGIVGVRPTRLIASTLSKATSAS
jgi:hypothetical protein